MVKLTAQLKNTGDVQAHAFRLLQFVIGAGVRDHDRHPVALLHLQGISNAFTHDDLLLARLEVGPRAVLHVVRQRAEARFLRRIHPFHLDGAQVYPALHQPGKVDIGRGSSDARAFLYFVERIAPVGPGLVNRLDFPVRYHRQNAVIQFALEAVHGAQADNQHRHAQRNTDGRDDGDERHHAAATATAAKA